MDQVVLFLLLRCMCTVWWPSALLAAPAEDSVAQARRGRVSAQEEPLQSTPDVLKHDVFKGFRTPHFGI